MPPGQFGKIRTPLCLDEDSLDPCPCLPALFLTGTLLDADHDAAGPDLFGGGEQAGVLCVVIADLTVGGGDPGGDIRLDEPAHRYLGPDELPVALLGKAALVEDRREGLLEGKPLRYGGDHQLHLLVFRDDALFLCLLPEELLVDEDV